MSENVRCSADLLKFEDAFVSKIHNVDCVIIPIKRNDLYTSLDSTTLKPKSVYWNFDVLSRREVGQYGDTHNIKQNFSKEFRESDEFEQAYKEKRQGVYFGNGKPLVFENGIENANVPTVPDNEMQGDCPF